MRRSRIGMVMAALALLAASTVAAQEQGSWALKLGVHVIDPKSDNGSIVGGALPVKVRSDVQPTIMAEYFVRENLGLEVVAATPFRHEVLVNGTLSARVKHLPPVVSVQYHFRSGSPVSFFVGAGINYTFFFDEQAFGALKGVDLKLKSSLGPALHAGVDMRIGNRWSLGIDARWIDIDTDAEANGASVGTIHVDPLAFGVYFQRRY